MRDAVIAAAVRTAVGKAPKGTLKDTRPDEMGAAVIKEAMARVPGLALSDIDDVIMGCAMPEAEQGMNIARAAAIRAGLPVETSAMTINRFCSSAAIDALAADRIRTGGAEAALAGGLESMSMIPMGGHIIRPNPTWSTIIRTSTEYGPGDRERGLASTKSLVNSRMNLRCARTLERPRL